MTLRQAADELGVTPDYLRHRAQTEFGWTGEQAPLAKRLELHKIGRDWYASRIAVAAERDRREGR